MDLQSFNINGAVFLYFITVIGGFVALGKKNVFLKLLGIILIAGGILNLLGALGVAQASASSWTAAAVAAACILEMKSTIAASRKAKEKTPVTTVLTLILTAAIAALYFVSNLPFDAPSLSLPNNPVSTGLETFLSWINFFS